MSIKNKLAVFIMSVICFHSFDGQLYAAQASVWAQETPPSDDLPDEPTQPDTDPVADPVDKDKIKKKIKADFFLDFDFGEEVVNLTPTRLTPFYEAARDSLVYGDYSGGFRVTKYSEIAAGLGGRMSWHFPNKTGLAGKLWLNVGLIPYAGRSSVSNQFQPTLDKALSAKALKVPMEAVDFLKWAETDSVNYASSGGLIFSVGVGVPGVNIGADYVVEGTFATYVEKVSPTEVYVMLSTIEAKSLNMQVDATLASIGVTKYKEVEEGMSYMINFADPVGAMAYHDLIRGNVAAIQRLIADPSVTAIQRWEKLNRTQLRRLKHFSFGIPFVMNWGWTSGNIYEFTDTKAFYDSTRAEVDYGIYLKEKRKKIFKSMAVKTQSFYGSVYRMYNYDNDLMTKYIFGQYIYNADDNKTKTKDMNKTIADMKEKTGLSEILAVNIPGYKKLRFSRINLEVNFDEDQTLRLMNITQGMNPTALASRANQMATMFMTNENTSLELCTPQETEIPMSSAECLAKYIEANARASSNLVKAAQVMKSHFENGRDKEFAMAYASFGRAMLENATMFQTILGLAGSGVEIVYDIKNTYFSMYRVVYTTTDSVGVYKRMATDKQSTWVFGNDLNRVFDVAANY